MDVFGKALHDYYMSQQKGKLWLHNNYGSPEDMPVDVFFRSEDDFSELEELALSHTRGKILDIGAGVGAHSLVLQSYNLDVTAIEISAVACEIMKKRGVKKIINGDILSSQKKYDTLLLLMNGIGLAGDIAGLTVLLQHFKTLLKTDGQIIFDSSDISYLYSADTIPKDHYYGEISYQYEYECANSDWFKWLYVDFDHLKSIAKTLGFFCELLFEDDMDQYLARMVLIR